MKFLNFGSLNLDIVYTVDHCVRPGETLASEKIEYFCGGKGLNQSIALAKAGAQVYHAGCVGADGAKLIKELESNGVNTSFIKKTDAPSGHAIIQVDKSGQNSILIFGGANRLIDKAQIDSVFHNFSQPDVLFLQNEINVVGAIIDTAYSKSMTVVFNPSPFSDLILELPLDKVSWFVVNKIEAHALTGRTETDEIISEFKVRYPNSNILLTLGEKGSYCHYNEKTYYQPIFNVKAIDTTAAGDTYLGYFFALLDSCGVEKAMQYASAASALAVSRQGASASIPLFNETEKFI